MLTAFATKAQRSDQTCSAGTELVQPGAEYHTGSVLEPDLLWIGSLLPGCSNSGFPNMRFPSSCKNQTDLLASVNTLESVLNCVCVCVCSGKQLVATTGRDKEEQSELSRDVKTRPPSPPACLAPIKALALNQICCNLSRLAAETQLSAC